MSRTKKKVLFLISSLKVRGAERMLINLVNRLDAEQFSIDVVALSRDNPIASEIHSASATFRALPRSWRYDIRPALGIRELIVREHVDTVIAFDIFTFFYVWLALRNLSIEPNILISIHNIKPRSVRHRIQNFAYARLLSGRETFISVCNAQADYWSKRYRIPRRNFTTIYNGVDAEVFAPSNDPDLKKSIRTRFNIPLDAFVILQVASLTPEKRHEDALAALHYLTHQDRTLPLSLVFVGMGSSDRVARLKALAHEYGISDRVYFLGVQTDVKQFYEIADLFTLTSVTETFSVSALEAMSMGVPCVLTNVGGAHEMIVNNINGLLVSPRDPVSIAQGWITIYENRACFDPRQIRHLVIERFLLSDCVRRYGELILG